MFFFHDTYDKWIRYEVAQHERSPVSGWPSMAEEKQRPFCTFDVSANARKNFTAFTVF
jgi:hypothetical protein